MESVVTWVALFAGCTASVAIIGFWLNFADRISKAKEEASKAVAKAEAASKEAADVKESSQREVAELKNDIHGLNTQFAASAGAFATYREQAAREARDFVTREMLSEFEKRVTDAADKNADRISKEVGKLGERLDGFLQAMAVQTQPPPTKRR